MGTCGRAGSSRRLGGEDYRRVGAGPDLNLLRLAILAFYLGKRSTEALFDSCRR